MRANNGRELTRSGLLWHPVLMSDSCWQGVVGAGTLSLPVLILCLCTVRQHSPVGPRPSGLYPEGNSACTILFFVSLHINHHLIPGLLNFDLYRATNYPVQFENSRGNTHKKVRRTQRLMDAPSWGLWDKFLLVMMCRSRSSSPLDPLSQELIVWGNTI